MAITTINDLTEVQSAGANDVLPISTASGVKKIKASAIGGSGESADITILATATGTMPFGASDITLNASTDKTIEELVAIVTAGKAVKVDGAVKYTNAETNTYNTSEIRVAQAGIIPAAIWQAISIDSNKDGLMLNIYAGSPSVTAISSVLIAVAEVSGTVTFTPIEL